MYGELRFKSSFAALPKWLQDYFVWHRDQTRTAKAISKESKAKYLIIYASAMMNVAGSLIDRVHSHFTSFWPAGWIKYFALLV